jgi:tetratricopeptide (TPR) repeat protein
VKTSQTIKTVIGIASLFVFGLVVGEILKHTNNADPAERSRILFTKAAVAADEGDDNKSIDLLSKSIKLDSANIEARNYLGKVLLRLRKFSEAIETLNVTTVDAETLHLRGDAHFALEQYSAAFHDYSESLTLAPNADAYVGLGNVFLRLNRIDESINNYTKAIEHSPDCDECYAKRGMAFNIAGKYSEALSDYDSAIKISPANDEYQQSRNFTLLLMPTK